MATFGCADAIDIVLRTRATTRDRMNEALRSTAYRRGKADRLHCSSLTKRTVAAIRQAIAAKLTLNGQPGGDSPGS